MRKQDFKTVFEPIRSRRTFEEVSHKIKGLIFDGTLKPGQKLPSEEEIARLFHVGRQSVREALRVLELSGFISTRPGVKGGPVIENTMLGRIAALFQDAFRFHKVSMEDFTTARKGIETCVLESVFLNADQSDIDNIAATIIRAKEKLDEGASAFEENMDFHRQLANASRNYLFVITVESILAVLSDFRSRLIGIGRERSLQVVEFHGKILDAIVAGRREEAKDLLEKDLGLVNANLASETETESRYKK